MTVNPLLARVRSLIQESGRSQNALARAGIATQAAISKWFTQDSAEPGSAALGRLVTFLGANGHWVLTGQGDRYALNGGGDKVFAAGKQAGRLEASEALEALRVGPEAADPTATKSAERARASKEALRRARRAHQKPNRAG